jgi:hypothetical protein
MEQRDYLLREIEKIGVVLRAIIDRLRRKKDTEVLEGKEQSDETLGILLEETGFDLNAFLEMDENSSKKYLSGFKGFNNENLELLASILFETGFTDNFINQPYLVKSLMLYQICNSIDFTYSFERERQIQLIKVAILENGPNTILSGI